MIDDDDRSDDAYEPPYIWQMTDEDRAAGLTYDQAKKRADDRGREWDYLVVYGADGRPVYTGPGIDAPTIPVLDPTRPITVGSEDDAEGSASEEASRIPGISDRFIGDEPPFEMNEDEIAAGLTPEQAKRRRDEQGWGGVQLMGVTLTLPDGTPVFDSFNVRPVPPSAVEEEPGGDEEEPNTHPWIPDGTDLGVSTGENYDPSEYSVPFFTIPDSDDSDE